jgi:iron only hydrogenase large subunit-like protein
MNHATECTDLLRKKAKLVALLAPSFPIVYNYPQIVARLKALGFSYVLEVSAGAMKTNEAVNKLFKDNPQGRYITSPCAGFVRMVRAQYPRFVPYLAFQADSPMIATARIALAKYPGCRPVFIGPCLAKKLESTEDYPDLNILVLTYKELDGIFQEFGIGENVDATNAAFDIAAPETRIYPMDGGLTITSGVQSVLKEEEIRIVSGAKNIPSALEEFEKNPKIRLLDILFCDGGCISGPGIVSKLSVEERKKKVLEFSGKS